MRYSLLLLPEQDDLLLLLPEQDELVEKVAGLTADVGKLAPWWPTLPAAASHVLAWPRTDQTHILSSENPGSCPSDCTTQKPEKIIKGPLRLVLALIVSSLEMHGSILKLSTIGAKAVAFAISEGNLRDDMLSVYHP